ALREPLLEPGARGGRVREPEARSRRAAAHLDGVAAELLHHAKAVLVGEVVAEEHRHAAGEGLLAHEGGNRPALVVARGLELRHHLAALHLDTLAKRPRRLRPPR